MRILIGHNYYLQRGGEDAVFESESALLQESSNDVLLYERSNEEIGASLGSKFKGFRRLKWSQQSYQEIKDLIRKFQPEIAHFHNIFYTITPSVYYACREEGIPVVQTQHNFRLLCSNGLYYRNHQPCEECSQKTLMHGVRHKCFQNSYLQTAALANMLEHHWRKGTWKDQIDLHITLSDFSRQKYLDAGIASEKIIVKPNFVDVQEAQGENEQGFALYVGRFSEEKGISFLVDAWKDISDLPLKIIGDGPLKEQVETRVSANVELLGYQELSKVDEYIRKASFLIVPSQCYENFPRIIPEAYASGTPVLASRLGSLKEIVEHEKTGLLFAPQDKEDLKEKVHWVKNHPQEMKQMGQHCQEAYRQKYTKKKNYDLLLSAYHKARENFQKTKQ